MENKDFVIVKSASNYNIVVNVPELMLRRVWHKKGSSYPIERNVLFQAYYHRHVESLFKQGLLVTDDKEFLKSVGLMDEDGTTDVIELTDAYLTRLIKTMPVNEVKQELGKLSQTQLRELADYAISHYKELGLDRVDLFTKATGKNIMGAIDHLRKAQEV